MAADRFLDTEGLRHLWEKIKAWIPFLSRKTQSIPFGQVDSTSTSTVFTATVDGIDELRDGVCCYLRNGVVTSASGFTININGLGAKPVYNTMASATALTTHFNINYTMLFIYNSTRVSGGCWDMYVGYDTNTTYNLNINYTTIGHINVGAYPLQYYSLCAFDINDKLTPFVTTATTSTGKTLVPSVFPIGAKIYASNYNLSANTSFNDANYLLTTAANQDLRYSSVNHNLAIFPNNTFNRVFMPVIVDVANNTFTLTTQTTNGYTNNFTNERSLKADNFYIEIGFNGKYDYSYYCTLIQNNDLYYYDGTRLIEYSIYKSSIIDVPEYTIEKLASAETGYSSSYVLKKDNVQVGATINIPKDMVVSNGEVKTVTVADEPYQGAQVGDKYIDLTIANTAQNHIYIPVKDLVDVYVAGNGIQISNNNYISVKVNQNQSNGLGVGYDGISMYVVTPSINGVGGTNGSMLATDKEKLDGIEAGAEENVIETVKVSGTALQVTNKAVNIETETAYDPTTNKIATMSDVESATPNVGHLKTDNTTAQTPSASESFTGDINLHKVAKTGSYGDLLNKPNLSAYVPYTDTDYVNIGTVAFNPKTRTFSGSGWYRIYRGSSTSVVHFLLSRSYNSPAPEGYDVDVEMSDSAEFTVTDDDWGVATITQNAGYFNSASAQEMSKIRVYGYNGGPSGNPNNVWLCIDIYIYDRTQYNNSYRVSGYLLSSSANSASSKFYGFSDLTEDDIAYAEFCQGKNSTKYYLEFDLVNGFKTNKTAEATAFKKTGGTSSQFLKADGSVDSNTYATTSQLPSLPLSIANGGTGKTTAEAAANALIGGLPTWTANPSDDVYLIRRDTGGSSTFGQVKFSTVWNYIKSKIASILGIGGSNGVPTAPTAAAGTNTTQIATTAFVQGATNGMAIDTNVVHKTGNENVGGVKTFTNNVKVQDADVIFDTKEDEQFIIGIARLEQDVNNGIGGLRFYNQTFNQMPVLLRNVMTPMDSADAANKEYVDYSIFNIMGERVRFLSYTGEYGLAAYSLCAFAKTSNGMILTSFTTTSGTGQKSPVSYKFPIGCNIYFHNDTEGAYAGSTWTLFTSYRHVDARYTAITGTNVSLGDQSTSSGKYYTSSVFLHVMIDGNYWIPYYKEGVTTEILVSLNQLQTGNYYIYLGKTTQEIGDEFDKYFCLEDNNPLYYYDGTNLIDWATRLKTIIEWQSTQDMSLKADKVEEATNGNLAGLDYTGNLTDSGLAADEVATLGTNQLTNYYKKTEIYSKSETDALVRAASDFEYEEVSVLPTASASTKGKFYLYNGHRYVTTEKAGGVFSWTDLGSYDIDLDGYVTKSNFDTELAIRPSYERLDSEAQMQSMINNHTWVEGVIYYTVEED